MNVLFYTYVGAVYAMIITFMAKAAQWSGYPASMIVAMAIYTVMNVGLVIWYRAKNRKEKAK